MTASHPPGQKLALVLPSNRLWGWHAILADRLMQHFAVDVFVRDSSPYPRLLAAWLTIEQRLFHSSPLLSKIRPEPLNAQRAEKDTSFSGYDVVVNLSGETIAASDALSIRYDDSPDELALFARLMAKRHAALSIWSSQSGRISSSYAATEDTRGLRTALPHVIARSIDLIERAACDRNGLSVRPAREAIPPAPQYAAGRLVAFAAGVTTSFAMRLLTKPFVRRDHWELAFRKKGDGERDDPNGYRLAPSDADSFFADPFLFSIDGKRLLFAEQLYYSDWIGKIVCAEVSDDGQLSPFKDVLVPPYHLSYPFVFEDGGSIYMLPESGAANALDLYVRDPSTGAWQLDTRLMSGAKISDATLFRHGGLYWILASTSSEHASTWDELSAFYATSLKGPWLPHAANPLISDLRSARPAGHVIQEGGRLIRPAQDCEDGYGGAIAWCEIDKLTPTEFEERVVSRTKASRKGYRGMHTYNADDAFEVVDLKRTLVRMPKWISRR